MRASGGRMGKRGVHIRGAVPAVLAGSVLLMWLLSPGLHSPAGTVVAIDVVLATDADDVEESSSGSIDASSSDLELIRESSNQIVGLRFAAVGVPSGATVAGQLRDRRK